MDYEANSKMMEEEVQKEYLFPKDDERLVKFNTFNQEQQLNSIYIGSLISEIGEEKYIRLKSGENEIEKDKLKQYYTQELCEVLTMNSDGVMVAKTLWKGKDCTNLEYRDLPHELEAYHMQDNLYKEYKK